MGQRTPITNRSILIVEDEALIRFDLVDYFEDAGFKVFEAENADEAITVLDRNSCVRVVLTDIQMPGSMDGLRLAHHVRDRFPPTILFIVSGAIVPDRSDLPAGSCFLAKPFNPRVVVRKVEGLSA